ncbi:MAG TPA: Mur ligase family protein, partial [Bryobacteraceae bacterium]|nr:Mur ligase family protein [Bryobacteraceae bacterium]
MNYEDAVRFLYSLGNEVKAAKLGLGRMSVLLEALGDPHLAGDFIHVAGTNGKGSTCAMVESVLRLAGIRTGLYTSPHLAEPTERISISGHPVRREVFAAAFDQVHRAAERLIASGALDLHPTYFETVTAMAFVAFREAEVRTTVLEVGLGGRLDATNVVLPRLAVITPVDFDHEVFLGRGLSAIAEEKAGILKRGVPAVIAAQRPEAAQALAAAAAALGV